MNAQDTTPRTDAVEDHCGGNCMGRNWVDADFARGLERELRAYQQLTINGLERERQMAARIVELAEEIVRLRA